MTSLGNITSRLVNSAGNDKYTYVGTTFRDFVSGTYKASRTYSNNSRGRNKVVNTITLKLPGRRYTYVTSPDEGLPVAWKTRETLLDGTKTETTVIGNKQVVKCYECGRLIQTETKKIKSREKRSIVNEFIKKVSELMPLDPLFNNHEINAAWESTVKLVK